MKQYLNKEFLLSNKQLVIKATAIIVILAVAFFVFLAGDGEQDVGEDILVSSGQEVSLESEPQSAESESASIIVDVGGAVQAPQVVELRSGSRVADAISAAGGLRKRRGYGRNQPGSAPYRWGKGLYSEKGRDCRISPGASPATGSGRLRIFRKSQY